LQAEQPEKPYVEFLKLIKEIKQFHADFDVLLKDLDFLARTKVGGKVDPDLHKSDLAKVMNNIIQAQQDLVVEYVSYTNWTNFVLLMIPPSQS
jgi:hypothetical protein